MVMKVEKSALLGKPSICFILKKNPKYISFHSAFHPVPQRKEVRKLTAYLVNGRLPDLLSTPPGGGSYSSHLAGKHTPVSLSPPGRPPPCQHLLPPPPGIISTSQHRFPDCFTSCCQEFSTLRLTSTPCFHVLCCCFFFFSRFTVLTQLQKMATNQVNDLEHCREGEKVSPPCHCTMWSQIQVNLY